MSWSSSTTVMPVTMRSVSSRNRCLPYRSKSQVPPSVAKSGSSTIRCRQADSCTTVPKANDWRERGIRLETAHVASFRFTMIASNSFYSQEGSMKNGILTLVAIVAFGSCLFAAGKPVTVALKDGMGKDVGTAKLSDGPGGKGVKIDLNLKN